MKIRLLIDSNHLGGIETHLMNLCEELVKRHYECSIIFVCAYENNILYSMCKDRGLNYSACTSFTDLVHLLRKDRPDIIHAHGYKANIYARLIGMLCKIAIVTTFHAGEQHKGRLKLYNFLDRWSSFFSNNICINKAIAKKLPSSATIIPSFVYMPDKPNQLKMDKPFHIYFIGRVSPEKGPFRFCQLAENSSEEFEWHMVGTGPLLKECHNLYQKSLQFHGAVTNMEEVWPEVDLLCITSTEEGLPLVLLEAMSRGIPVVSFDVGTIKEVLSENDCIIDCYKLKLMQKCISSYFTKTMIERQAMADREIKKIKEHFSNEVVLPQIEAFYDRILYGKASYPL